MSTLRVKPIRYLGCVACGRRTDVERMVQRRAALGKSFYRICRRCAGTERSRA